METTGRYATLVAVTNPDGQGEYCVVVLEDHGHWEDGGECDCCTPETVLVGPCYGNAMLPADVKASRWARARGIEYR